MDRKTGIYLLALCAVVALAVGVWSYLGSPDPQAPAVETELQVIPLRGASSEERAELSGLAWWNDELVLLPQYPDRFSDSVFVLPRAAIEAFLDGESTAALEPRLVPISAPGLQDESFDGFEAIAFADDEVYVTIEVRRGGESEGPVGRLLHGRVEGALERIVLDVEGDQPLGAQTSLANTGYEALVLHGNHLIALYETNGEVNAEPRGLTFDRGLTPSAAFVMAPIEYRITDATDVDREGHFWVANYHWPGAPWHSGSCSLTERYGQGESHSRCATVERFVELQLRGERIEPTDRAPVLLQLIDDEHARNWEGVARLGDRGFLVVTDEHPETILGFVPLP